MQYAWHGNVLGLPIKSCKGLPLSLVAPWLDCDHVKGQNLQYVIQVHIYKNCTLWYVITHTEGVCKPSVSTPHTNLLINYFMSKTYHALQF